MVIDNFMPTFLLTVTSFEGSELIGAVPSPEFAIDHLRENYADYEFYTGYRIDLQYTAIKEYPIAPEKWMSGKLIDLRPDLVCTECRDRQVARLYSEETETWEFVDKCSSCSSHKRCAVCQLPQRESYNKAMRKHLEDKPDWFKMVHHRDDFWLNEFKNQVSPLWIKDYITKDHSCKDCKRNMSKMDAKRHADKGHDVYLGFVRFKRDEE